MLHTFNYTLLEVAPYINWIYFFHAWGLSGKPQQEKDRLQAEAELMLKDMDQQFHTHAIVGLFDANADGDKKAKYELMRTKHSIEATISKIATSYKSASDKNLANANAVIKSSRGVDY